MPLTILTTKIRFHQPAHGEDDAPDDGRPFEYSEVRIWLAGDQHIAFSCRWADDAIRILQSAVAGAGRSGLETASQEALIEIGLVSEDETESVELGVIQY